MAIDESADGQSAAFIKVSREIMTVSPARLVMGENMLVKLLVSHGQPVRGIHSTIFAMPITTNTLLALIVFRRLSTWAA